MNLITNALRRMGTPVRATMLAALMLSAATESSAQVVAGGDFDICDNCRNLTANTMFLRGPTGGGTNTQAFVLTNAATADADDDRDGYGPGVNFNNLVVSSISPFVNVADPSQVIASSNFVLNDFLNPLENGFANVVNVSVRIPAGTRAGIYRGSVQIRDTLTLPPGTPVDNPNGELLRVDVFSIEIEVLPNSGVSLVEPNSAAPLDSLVLSGRPGQTVQGVGRVANLGNVDLTNISVQSTDLVATSGTGLRIRSQQISFTPEHLTRIGIGDTSRFTVNVRVPSGILAGRYSGELLVQGDAVDAVRIPFALLVTTPGDIVFENNPVFSQRLDDALIIFNADPGSQWSMRIFDMQGLTAFATEGQVFAGAPGSSPGDPVFPGDEAVRYSWNLRNGRGENVAGGMYLVVIEAIQGAQRRQLRGKLMVIR